MSLHVKKGDQVQVISGANRGANGKVIQVLIKKNRVLIEGVNMIKKHTKKSQDNPQGKIVEREGALHISNVKVVEVVVTEKPKSKKKKAA